MHIGNYPLPHGARGHAFAKPSAAAAAAAQQVEALLHLQEGYPTFPVNLSSPRLLSSVPLLHRLPSFLTTNLISRVSV